MRTTKNIRQWMPMAVASTLICTGCLLMALSLALNTFSVTESHSGSTYNVTIRGVLSKCQKLYQSNHFVRKTCTPWSTEMKSKENIVIHRNVMLLLMGGSISCGVIAIIVSIFASCIREPRYVFVVAGFELTSTALALASVLVYAIKCLESPFRPGESFFILIGGTVLLLGSFVCHCYVREVKFYGKVCCTVPASTPDYRYQRTEDTVAEV